MSKHVNLEKLIFLDSKNVCFIHSLQIIFQLCIFINKLEASMCSLFKLGLKFLVNQSQMWPILTVTYQLNYLWDLVA